MTSEYIGFCATCGDSTGYLSDEDEARDEIRETHDLPTCRIDVAEEGETVILDTDVCGDWKVGDWIGSSTDETVVKIDHFEFYAGFGFMGTSADAEDSVYLDTGAPVEPVEDDEEES